MFGILQMPSQPTEPKSWVPFLCWNRNNIQPGQNAKNGRDGFIFFSFAFFEVCTFLKWPRKSIGIAFLVSFLFLFLF